MKVSVVNHVVTRTARVLLKPVLDLQILEIREIHDITSDQHRIVHGSDRCDLGIRVGRRSARLTERARCSACHARHVPRSRRSEGQAGYVGRDSPRSGVGACLRVTGTCRRGPPARSRRRSQADAPLALILSSTNRFGRTAIGSESILVSSRYLSWAI